MSPIDNRDGRRFRIRRMHKLIIATLVAASMFCGEIGLARELARLNWINGDQLAGDLVSASESHVSWHAPVFSEPFSIDIRYLNSIRFQVDAADRTSDEPFRIFTRSGDVMNGQILQITPDRIVIQGGRHGRLSLKRAHVRSFRRLNDPALVFEGPSGLAGWSTISRSRKVGDWKNGPQGELVTQVVGAELYRDLELPTVSEIEMTLSWQQKPGFLVTFAGPDARRVPKHTVKLETWDDELVMQALASTGDFEQVQTLAPDAKSIQLRLLWDQSTGELSCYSRAGELLAKLKTVTQNGENLTCLYIKNKGSDLKVANIRVRSWNGTALSALAEGRSHVQTLDGTFTYGHIRTFDHSTGTIVFATESGIEQIPIEQLSGADLGGLETETDRNKPVQVSFTDGTMLSGTLRSINDGTIKLSTPYSVEPVSCTLEGAFLITFLPDASTRLPAPGDVLEYSGARLHGRLAPVGAQGKLGWQPVGSQNASPLLPNDPARVIRKIDRPNEFRDASKRDMIYLRNGDVIPCRVVSVDEDVVALEPAFADPVTVPRDQVKAIDLGADKSSDDWRFDHPGWLAAHSLENAIERSANQAVFYETGTLSHQRLLSGNSIQFDVEWTSSEPVSLTLGLRSRPGARAGLSFKLYFVGDQIHVQNLQMNRGFVYRHRLRDRRANVNASLKGSRLELRINGQMALNQTINRERRLDQGLTFAVKRERPRARADQARQPIVTLSNLRMGQLRRTPGSIILEADKKEQLLTVPRNRKNNPPTHLIVARNGDMLRGRFIRMTSEQVVMRSRFDDMSFPRERIAMLVWLDKAPNEPSEQSTVRQLKSPMQAVLLGGITFSFSANRMSQQDIIGSHPLLGDCRLPIDQVREVRLGPLASVEPSKAFRDWVLSHAPEPRFATVEGSQGSSPAEEAEFGIGSPLVGTQVENFSGEMSNGKRFQLAHHRDKIVVLDFWATWCGPCIRAMPELMAAVDQFPDDKVILVGVNLQENRDTVNEFLEARGWKLNVLFDPDGRISQRFQVEAIPQTVIIEPGGTIARLHVGAHADLQEELKKALEQILGDGVAGDANAATVQPAGG